ncbi:bacillithiol biosynthesis deacetylase BshB2 [Alicyclobacillus mengziensis]|uniref:Bacillithiol biosynthesis deacetylase BshB2 n=1 Tax=Alicyclobacillus mengziensis TaxID=2931921 RepID=A0A9X7W1L6_9BACL|nr:bacillithiol biosynthesis deacetylase BshB2 [Alicyclobacillus mengziensis]QSO48969.1 bacillithiol biosynthesis deacetylase BshB2 [Alicyclobacillus mengziensis]
MERHVLAVYPHPDDESFGKAGTLALYTKSGTPVTLICGTLGQMGRNMGKPFFANRETLPALREQELRDACEVLGIKDLRLLRLRDKTLEFEDPDTLADHIEKVIREVKPSLVITYYPRHGVHPDHNAMAAATVRAIERLGAEERPVLWGSPVTKNAREELGPPDVVNDVSRVLETKFAAIRAHKSQSQAMLQGFEQRMQTDPEFKAEYIRNMSQESYWIVPVE